MIKWVYDDILRTNKVRYEFNKQDYIFARKMDDVLVKGKDEDIVLNIITPLVSDDYKKRDFLQNQLVIEI